jgi:hypothetical protein
MADSNDGPVFRASKRRKVIQKRRDDDELSDQDVATRTTSTTVAGSKQQDVETETREGSVSLSHVRPSGLRKGGVAFSSTRNINGSGTSSVVDTNAPPTPLNPVEHAQARFVAPTGHVASADDKHMCVFLLPMYHPELQKRLTIQGWPM